MVVRCSSGGEGAFSNGSSNICNLFGGLVVPYGRWLMFDLIPSGDEEPSTALSVDDEDDEDDENDEDEEVILFKPRQRFGRAFLF